ncbi:MAG: FMN-binding protein [Candidatus Omnitrophica bacterium]|nr:FMN-binding protein [Candidatus Omnitrophota bacterium]
MKKYQLLTYIFCAVFFTGIFYNTLKTLQSPDRKKELNALNIVLSQSDEISHKNKNPLHYKGYKKNTQTGKKILNGVAFLTTDLAPKITGYSGPIKILVGVDTKGNITRVEMISHSETSSYILSIDSFLAQFTSFNINNKFQIGQDVDGISRATVTSEAITRSIEKGLKTVAQKPLNLNAPEFTTEKKPFHLSHILIPVILFSLAILGITRKSSRLRWAALIGGFIYFGIIHSTMFSVVQIANTGLFKFPVFGEHPLWHMIVGFILISSLIFGMAYCGSLCPFASVQEWLFSFGKRFHKEKNLLSENIDKNARYIKHIILLTVVGTSFILGNASAANVEIFITFFTLNATTFGWAFLGGNILGCFFIFRFWCRYFCPAGAFNGLLSQWSLFKIRFPKDCEECQKCAKACPMDAIKIKKGRDPAIDYPECILCNKCIEACPGGELQYKKTENRRQITDEKKY